MSSPFDLSIIQNYTETKQRYPAEGRRKWRLRVAEQFWTAVGSGGQLLAERMNILPESVDSDPDPLDSVTHDGHELGLIVRTDFSDEPSWAAFRARLQDSERELILANGEKPDGGEQDDNDDASGDEDEDEDAPPAIFHIVNPSSAQERGLLINISNLTALRLFNDVDVRPSQTLPPDTKRIDPPNRLVDYHGWQEFYRGKAVWIYDTRSNTDQCVRVVCPSGDLYGTATGDSWRARVSHICELQIHLSSGAIRIDFGGLDRWDFDERRRNMLEAERK